MRQHSDTASIRAVARTCAMLAMAVVCGSAQAQITIGNSVFPQVGTVLHYGLDASPGAAITVTPPGVGQRWDFSSLVPETTWTETLRPAGTGAAAPYFANANLVYTQTAPASARFALLPGSNGAEAYLSVTGTRVSLLGFGAGSDALGLGLAAYVNPQAVDCNPVCSDDTSQAFVTRVASPGLEQNWAPKQFFDARFGAFGMDEVYPFVALPGLSTLGGPGQALRLVTRISTETVVDASGSLTLPGGDSFNVLRQRTFTSVSLRLDAKVELVPGFAIWTDVTEQIKQDLPHLNWGLWEQYSYRYADATSAESLAITYGPIARFNEGDSLAIQSVQFKHLAPVPEPSTLSLLLAGALVLACWCAVVHRGRHPCVVGQRSLGALGRQSRASVVAQ